MVLARHYIAERLKRVGFNALRQLLRLPGFANLALGARAVALGKKDLREREPASGTRRLTAREAPHGRGVGPLLPQPRFRPPAQRPHARPARVVGNESRVPAEVRFS